MDSVNLITAFLAGIISFISPCVLPIVPGYISFVSGVSLQELKRNAAVDEEQRKRQLRQVAASSIFFVLGFSLVFVAMGASATYIGNWFAVNRTILARVAGIVIIVFGLHTMGLTPIKWLNYEKRLQTRNKPDGLEEFLSFGEPTVYMTFGSLGPYESEQLDRLLVEAVEMSGCRAIIQSPVQGTASTRIFRCHRAPHARVFPRCAAVVHHGGAGTTHAALRAGCPSIVVEHAFDQLFWATELERLGVAGKVLHRNKLTSEQLAEVIRCTLESKEMKIRAESLGQRMRNENGVKSAVALIESKFH